MPSSIASLRDHLGTEFRGIENQNGNSVSSSLAMQAGPGLNRLRSVFTPTISVWPHETNLRASRAYHQASVLL
eukprot:161577-Amphidinium_carterae.1